MLIGVSGDRNRRVLPKGVKARSGVIEDGVALKVKDGGREDNREDNEDNSELVLASIARDPRLTVRQLAANLPISKATVERVLKSLQGNGRLRRVGGTRGYWEILK